MSTNDMPNSDSEGTVPVSQALEMTQNWRTYLDTSEQDFNVRSYLVPIISFQNLAANNPNAEAVRTYIGLADPTDPTSSQLLFVPIVGGQEVLYRAVKGDGTPITNPGDDDSNIYDMTKACPPDCFPGTGGGLEG